MPGVKLFPGTARAHRRLDISMGCAGAASSPHSRTGEAPTVVHRSLGNHLFCKCRATIAEPEPAYSGPRHERPSGSAMTSEVPPPTPTDSRGDNGRPHLTGSAGRQPKWCCKPTAPEPSTNRPLPPPPRTAPHLPRCRLPPRPGLRLRGKVGVGWHYPWRRNPGRW